MASDLVTVTFKLERKIMEKISYEIVQLDLGKSETLRACLLLSWPMLKENPSLVKYIEMQGNGQ